MISGLPGMKWERTGAERKEFFCFWKDSRQSELKSHGVFLSESSKRNYGVGIMFDEASVKVTKSEEGLNVFDFLGNRPIENGLNFLGVHCKSGWRKNET